MLVYNERIYSAIILINGINQDLNLCENSEKAR